MTDARENPERPVVAVGVVAFRGSEVLLIRRGKPPKEGDWSIPGGRQQLGEGTRMTAAREVQEETGLAVKVGELIDVVDFIEPGEGGKPRFHYTLVDYMAEVSAGEPQAGDDAVEAAFLPLEEAFQRLKWAETRRVIALAARRRGLALPAGFENEAA